MGAAEAGQTRPRRRSVSPSEGESLSRLDNSDHESDLDATEFLQSDPLTSTKGSLAYAQHRRSQPSSHQYCRRCCRCCCRPLPPRSTKCILLCLGVVVVVWLSLSAGGFFAYKKYAEAPPDGQSPPWYPTPRGGTSRRWADSYRKAGQMVSRMTLPEKINITTGTGWAMGPAVGNTGPALHAGFPSLALQDGPLGIRFADNATAFPAGVTVGATWNKQLMYEWGRLHGVEARQKGIHAILGPSIGPLGRAPAGGRNWEGFGADPYLQGVAAASSIRGIQDAGVMATIKHLVANEQEHFRQAWEWGLPNAISSNVGDRTLHELYMWPFGDAVKAGVASVMCSYNMVNNSYACGNSKLLNGLLKDELGFQGFVMSDWLAQRAGVSTALAGLDMTMPGDGLFWTDGKSLWGSQLTRSVLNGSLPLDRLNDMVTRIVAAWYQLGQDRGYPEGPNFSSWTDEETGVFSPGSPSEQAPQKVNSFINVMGNHSATARTIAAEGTVLLKNDDFLPMDHDGYTDMRRRKRHQGAVHIGIFGEDAGPGSGPGSGPNACADRGCNQGTLAMGWGSGSVELPYLVTPVDTLVEAWKESPKVNASAFLSNSPPKPETLDSLDICIVFANADSGEGFIKWDSISGDRNDLRLQKGADDLIVSVADGCGGGGGGGGGEVLVVIHSVGPVVMERWIDHPSVKAVLLAHLPGQESGNAIADIIFARENPSGKLPWTIGRTIEDYGKGSQVMYLPNGVVPQQDFGEGLYIDYRHYDQYNLEPRFEFGFGLSYTAFDFANCTVNELKPKSALPVRRPEAFGVPPEYDNGIPDGEEALFPDGFRKLDKYIYPYLESLDDIVSHRYPYPDGYDVQQPPSEAGGDEGGNPDLWDVYVQVMVEITNIGARPGKVVPQLYLFYPETSNGTGVEFPVKVLRGFDKVLLQQEETQTVAFNVTRRDLSYWDVYRQNWVMVTEGPYKFSVGESSRDLRVSGTW